MFSFASRLWPSATAKMNIDNEIRADITPLNTYKDPINWKPRPAWPHRLDFVFIHDAVPDHESAWREPVGLKLWPNDLIDDFPSARVIIYQYERSWVKSIGDLVSPDHLRNQTQELLTFLEDERYRSSVPLVVFAHGFGGLLYEQAVVWSRASLDSKQVPISNVLRERKHTAFLFNTPHFGAGIAEWAMITAKSYGIRCAKTAQKQDWSPVKDEIADIATMQFEFRKILKSHGSAASLTGCFSTVQEPVSKLDLDTGWRMGRITRVHACRHQRKSFDPNEVSQSRFHMACYHPSP
ncbi:hypothetical protein F5B18DRAFT_63507 [Nemania serpens]|nr:hypothetical protein F5B18DRAFT_63507 [Nemania serpens]